MISASVSGPSLLAARGAPDADPAPGGRSAAMSGPEPGGPYSNTWHHRLVQRSLVLFSVGVVLALVLNLLQIQRNVTLFPEEVIATIFSSAWWVPPCCGTAAGEYPPAVLLEVKRVSFRLQVLFSLLRNMHLKLELSTD